MSVALVSLLSSNALADNTVPKKNGIEAARQQGYPVKTITPIFGQLLMFSFPKGFKPAFEDAKGAQYIQESVLDGETTAKWSQMLTVTGAKGLASNPGVFGVHDAFAAIVSCGVASPTGASYSEAMLLLVIKGERDYYTIQWAERGTASASPLKLDDAKWQERFKKLAPIKLCPIVPGEAAPYPSCVERA
ncbi:MAG: hypothetical protein NTX56_19355 [Proteobacteria bacterium]|nr:hypothetical protein [Pseudomonadota bacterium]